jgi:hypothetical protein
MTKENPLYERLVVNNNINEGNTMANLGNKYSARVLINGRSKAKEYRHEDRLFIEAKTESEFEVELKNHTSDRVMAIISVDGLDVIKGEPANQESAGYIIPANDSIKIKGFRNDEDSVGAFKFTARGKSYSKEQGHGGNQGIIAVRFIEERHYTSFTDVSSPNLDWWVEPDTHSAHLIGRMIF